MSSKINYHNSEISSSNNYGSKRLNLYSKILHNLDKQRQQKRKMKTELHNLEGFSSKNFEEKIKKSAFSGNDKINLSGEISDLEESDRLKLKLSNLKKLAKKKNEIKKADINYNYNHIKKDDAYFSHPFHSRVLTNIKERIKQNNIFENINKKAEKNQCFANFTPDNYRNNRSNSTKHDNNISNIFYKKINKSYIKSSKNYIPKLGKKSSILRNSNWLNGKSDSGSNFSLKKSKDIVNFNYKRSKHSQIYFENNRDSNVGIEKSNELFKVYQGTVKNNFINKGFVKQKGTPLNLMSVGFPEKLAELKDAQNVIDLIDSTELNNKSEDIDNSFGNKNFWQINNNTHPKGNTISKINSQYINQIEINTNVSKIDSLEQGLKKNSLIEEPIEFKYLDSKMNQRYEPKSRKTVNSTLFSITNEIATSIPQNQNLLRSNVLNNLNAFTNIEEMHTLLVNIYQKLKMDKKTIENKLNKQENSEKNDNDKSHLFIYETSLEL